jgi:amino acid adenylation domain-containing protein
MADLEGVAIIGMAGHFPGAGNVDEYWENIKNRVESIDFFTKEELLNKGVHPDLLNNPDYVYANGVCKDADKFDSAFFGFTPREADFIDPQHRLLLETCYEALEHSGYSSENYKGDIGVFAGAGPNNYILKNLIQHPQILRNIGELQTVINNDKDYLTTRVSYKLNLTGPSIDIQTACSTSLVAVHLACQNLLNYQCDMALAGGVFIQTPRGMGYMHQNGSIFSADGHCRPFDAKATGMLFGEGSGIVVLKRLEDAVNDHDTIWAVIKSTAINNDGSQKAGYMAPSVDGQAKVIATAQAYAGINPEQITYVEAHGTGTSLGDPVEIGALTKVFSEETDRKHFCAIGSVKANIGHLDAAAGVAGLIKTVMAIHHQQLPPSINFTSPNLDLHLNESPFYVNTELRPWDTDQLPRRAAVSSFGVGGTNSHCIIEEWTENSSTPSLSQYHILPISAKSESALNNLKQRYLDFLNSDNQNLADVAYTLQNGRTPYKFRSLAVVKNFPDNREAFNNCFVTGKQMLENPRIVFMYTGQGTQYVSMARGLYEEFASFKAIVDRADNYLQRFFGFSLVNVLFGENAEISINNTDVAQPALFVIQYALTKLLGTFGIRPGALIGHSIGEITAACISGVYSFDDALKIVGSRGKLMQMQVPGEMLSIHKPVHEVAALIPNGVDIALNNAPNFCVVSGTFEAMASFQTKLSELGIPFSKLNTSHAFHSKLMEPALEPFKEVFSTIKPGNLEIPFISNVSGTWITPTQASSPDYWANHIRGMVNFKAGMDTLLQDTNTLFVEVGPGNSLTALLSQFKTDTKIISLPTLRHIKKDENDTTYFLNTIAQAWINGANIDWSSLYPEEIRFRVQLPTYPFERRKHWIDPVTPFSYDISYGPVNQTVETLSYSNLETEGNLDYRTSLDNEYVAPQSELEKDFVEIWQELLGISKIGIKDNFFELGGHSLLAAQLMNRINEKLRIILPLNIIFNAPTIFELAKMASLSKKVDVKDFKITKIDQLSKELPITFDQKRLWIISKIDNNPAYNIPFTYKFKGNLNIELLQKSLSILFNRHKILQSFIKTREINPFCYLNLNDQISLTVLDWSFLPEIERNSKIQQELGNEIRALFDIENGPLYRIYLIKTAENEHVFHFTVQHLVFDGWSWGIFVKELKQIYAALVKDVPFSLPELPFQYYDYAAWQAKNEIDYSGAITYWKKKLEGYSSSISFPYDRNRKPISSGIGGREEFILSPTLTREIKHLSSGESVTDFMTLVSAFALLLHRYTGNADINIGTPTANRMHSEIERIIGFFVNTLVLRFQFEENETYRHLLQKTKTTVLDALDHQELPFEKLVEALQPSRSLNINPIFQILFAWQNTPRPPLDLEGISSERIVVKKCVSPLDITIYMWENNNVIEGEIEFSEDILDRETIIRLKNNFLTLLEALVKKPDVAVQSIPLLSESEQKLLDSFNDTSIELPNKLLHQLFEEQAFKTPFNIAAKCGDKQITYNDLKARATLIALLLQKRNVKVGDVVGINVERSIDMLASVLAVLKCGACYLPLDPSFPEDRIRFMLEDSGVNVLITQQSFIQKYSDYVPDIILIDGPLDATGDFVNPQGLSQQLLAYTIYTSGSTGRPKGVKIHHEAVVNFIYSMAKNPGLSSTDKMLAVTTLSFDISILELLLPISFGGMVVIAKTEEVIQGKKLMSIIEQNSITILQATPATWNILIKSGWAGNSSLVALCGGEALTPSLMEQLYPRVKTLWNMYGPTETTVWSTCYKIEDPKKPVLVGKPIDNTKLIILNNGIVQPIGVSGEVCIGGKGVSRGYHNRQELTNEKFIIGPSSELIYKTGDVGFIGPDGNLKLMGRGDDQIKLRGYRIELSEIEKVICEIEGITGAVVRVFEFDDADVRLVGFVTTSDGYEFDDSNILQYLYKKLPGYMVPAAIKKIDSFPQTPNGKIDKKALVYDPKEIKKQETELKDLSDLEKSLFKIWSVELKTSRFGTNENFFDIGGNSVMLVQLSIRVNEYLGKELNILTYFEYPTIQSFANFLLNNDSNSNTNEKKFDRQQHLSQLAQRRRNNLQ